MQYLGCRGCLGGGRGGRGGVERASTAATAGGVVVGVRLLVGMRGVIHGWGESCLFGHFVVLLLFEEWSLSLFYVFDCVLECQSCNRYDGLQWTMVVVVVNEDINGIR